MKIFRYSGLPLTLSDIAAHKSAFQAAYDKAVEECGPDMLKMHERLKEIDDELATNWPTIVDTVIPKSKKAWTMLIDTYEAPIIIAKSKDNPKEIVMVIMDQPLG